ncbi:MAG: CRTAC1 family protein [Gammaproteobacteria bacterium]|nr:CRTAC1 family protein [Gammaproteobacteria bacterium]NNL46694.1 CRTAC1 family protein [Woeseiaceae bacterium]
MIPLFGVAACSGSKDTDKTAAPENATVDTNNYFRDVAAAAELDFVHVNGASSRKYLPEIMGAGGSVLDYDNDGWMDIYLVQSGQLPGSDVAVSAGGNRLFRNRGDGTFDDVTSSARVGDTGYGMGAAAADYDNDGDADLYVVNFGRDVLYRNNGDGTFTDVSTASGIDDQAWGSSAAFFDADGDGLLDLYVVNYLEFAVADHIDCGSPSEGVFSYCHPDVYEMQADVFYRGDGQGGFTDATAASGLLDTSGHGKGLGVVASDLDDDGDADLYVANDSTPNYLYRNLGDGQFEEVGLFTGTSHNDDGMTEAGMGTDAGDVNGDGLPDLIVTNLSAETNALYLGGEDFFDYGTRAAGLYEGSLMPVGFGVDFLDVDNDTDLDLFVTNGHVIDNIELTDDSQSFRQPSQLFLNDGTGRFSLVDAGLAGDIAKPGVGRGTMTFDYDNDGRLDVVVTRNNEAVNLYRNEWQGSGSWIGFELRGKTGNRDAIGARVTVEADGRRMVEEKKAGSSYQTSGDPRLHLGLGNADIATRVTVRWPGGGEDVFENLAGGRYYRLVEGATAPAPLPEP